VTGRSPATGVDDALWSAIGDPTRRRVLDLLLETGGGTATTLGEHLPVTRQAVAKHLGVLDRVGLVSASTQGRERLFRVDEVQLARAAAQLATVGSQWDARMRRIKQIAEQVARSEQLGQAVDPEPERGSGGQGQEGGSPEP